jgi:hypothetical protein
VTNKRYYIIIMVVKRATTMRFGLAVAALAFLLAILNQPVQAADVEVNVCPAAKWLVRRGQDRRAFSAERARSVQVFRTPLTCGLHAHIHRVLLLQCFEA